MKIVRVALISLLIVAAAICAYVPVQQALLRRRAERLLADIQRLQLRHSTEQDARTLMDRWRSYENKDVPCSRQVRRYQVELLDGLMGASIHSGWNLTVPLLRPYHVLGGRITIITAEITVIDGVVWGKSFYVRLDVPSPHAGYPDFPYRLLASARTVSRFISLSSSQKLLKDSEIAVTQPGHCSANCEAMYVEFTPFADQDKVNRLLDFDLSCINRRTPCRSRAELMPAAWKELTGAGTEEDWKRVENCELPLQVRGRDTQSALLVELRSGARALEDGSLVFDVRVLRRLKNADAFQVNSVQELWLSKDNVDSSSGLSVRDLRKGMQVVVLFQDFIWNPNDPFRELKTVSVNRCGIVDATPSNLQAVESGIARDFRPDAMRDPLPLPR